MTRVTLRRGFGDLSTPRCPSVDKRWNQFARSRKMWCWLRCSSAVFIPLILAPFQLCCIYLSKVCSYRSDRLPHLSRSHLRSGRLWMFKKKSWILVYHLATDRVVCECVCLSLSVCSIGFRSYSVSKCLCDPVLVLALWQLLRIHCGRNSIGGKVKNLLAPSPPGNRE